MLSHLVGESHQLFNRLPDKTNSHCGPHGYQTWSTPSDPHFVSRHEIARFLDRCHRPADRVIIKNLRGSLHQHASGLQIIQIVRPMFLQRGRLYTRPAGHPETEGSIAFSQGAIHLAKMHKNMVH